MIGQEEVNQIARANDNARKSVKLIGGDPSVQLRFSQSVLSEVDLADAVDKLKEFDDFSLNDPERDLGRFHAKAKDSNAVVFLVFYITRESLRGATVIKVMTVGELGVPAHSW